MKITCFIFVAYVLVMAAAVAELSTKQKSVKTGNSDGKVSNYNLKKKKNEYLKHLKLASGKEILKPENQTTDHDDNNIERYDELFRLTDSDFELVFKLQTIDISNYNDTIIKIVYSRESTNTKNENQFMKTAISEFENRYHVKVLSAGLFVDSQLPFLAASPDGLIGDDSIIVIKFPDSAKDSLQNNVIRRRKHTYLEQESEKLMLKVTLKYHYQVQGQLHITKRKFCYLVVWTPKGMSVEKINRDDAFWKSSMESFLRDFYMDFLLPEIIHPMLSDNYL